MLFRSMSADEEEDYKITHASIDIGKDGTIEDEWVPMRHMNKFIEGPVTEVEYIDVVPRQVIGTSASLIPFIAHDEANRALMGTHMQCQAVPLVRPKSPVVGTGMERAVATSMNRTVVAQFAGKVDYVDASKVVISLNKSEHDAAEARFANSVDERVEYSKGVLTYHVIKFERTSQSTC